MHQFQKNAVKSNQLDNLIWSNDYVLTYENILAKLFDSDNSSQIHTKIKKWFYLQGKLVQMSVGDNCIWGVNAEGQVKVRRGE